jgi:hypothetical protein
MTRFTAALVPLALVAVRLTVLVPATVGVPVMAPVVVLNERPVGNAPVSAKLVGVLVPEIV